MRMQSHDATKRSFVFIASDSSIDRDGDSLTQNNWDLTNYMLNPVVLADHDYQVRSVVAKSLSIGVDGDKLMFEPSFADAETSPFADMTYRLLLGGYLNTCSVGFIDNGSTKELLEVSIVAVPANPNAIVLAVKEGVLDEKEAKMYKSRLENQLKALEQVDEQDTKQVKSETMKVDLKTGAKFSQETKLAMNAILEHVASSKQMMEELLNDGQMDDDGRDSMPIDDQSDNATRPTGPTGKSADETSADAKDVSTDAPGAEQKDEMEVDPENLTEDQAALYQEKFDEEIKRLQGKVD